MFTNSILGNYSFNVYDMETYFGEFHVEIIEEIARKNQFQALPFSPTDEPPCNIVDDRTNFIGRNSINVTLDSTFWTLYFDGSNFLEGVGARSLFVDPQGNKHLMANQLEFICTSNTTEYEGLLRGLKKAIGMKVKNLKVFGDS